MSQFAYKIIEAIETLTILKKPKKSFPNPLYN